VDVISLTLIKNCEFSIQVGQVKSCDFLIKFLGEDVDLTLGVFIIVLMFPKLDLGKNLVGEGARHNETWVTSSTTQVNETTLS
jgi:hypothetical protein